jgi:hypothetical protein
MSVARSDLDTKTSLTFNAFDEARRSSAWVSSDEIMIYSGRMVPRVYVSGVARLRVRRTDICRVENNFPVTVRGDS